MKNIKTKATALALTTLMAASVIGTASASAATTGTTNTANDVRTIYFVNNKEWEDVYSYAWGENGAFSASFPGDELAPIGTTEKLGTSYEVYSIDVDTDDVVGVLFNEGKEHGEQSSDILLSGTASNCFYLDADNQVMPIKDFHADDVKSSTDSSILRLASTDTSKDVEYIGETSALKSDGSQIVYLDTKVLGGEIPTVSFVRTGGSVVAATSVKPMYDGNGNQIYGMYEVQVPSGTFMSVDIQYKDSQCTTDVNDATDSIKIEAENGVFTAVPCQRVYFNNNLSNMHDANQQVRAYVWNSIANLSETSFEKAYNMTYLKNDIYGVNIYFYDVPLYCDSIIFFTADVGTTNVTAQTQNIKLQLTTNTESELVIDGYYVTNTGNTMSQSVSLYDNQVRL